MRNLLEGLNPEQKEAVITTEGPLLVVAGAGAGKTKTLAHRIGHLIERGIPGEAILAITFTNKAAKEMRDRVLELLGKTSRVGNWGPPAPGIPWIGTFHGLGGYILREKGGVLDIPRSATILDQDDSLKLIKQSLTREGVDPKEFEPRRIQSLISRHKGNMGTAENIATMTRNQRLGEVLKRVFIQYEGELRTSHVLDFDDLLEKTVRLLEGHPAIRDHYTDQWHYIHVDEYQDTNEVQYRLVKLLSGSGKNVCVVGDSDQNIYSWRGASIANILEFEEDYPGAKIILLEENYRSTQNILTAANSVIAKNTMRKEKNLFTKNGDGEQLSVFSSYDEGDEARFVATRIAGLLRSGISPRAIAVLYRTNFQSRVLEEALLYSGIPYQVLGVRFYERKEVRDVIAYLRASLNPRSTLDIARIVNVPVRGVGKVTLEKIFRGEKDSLPKVMQVKVATFFSLLANIKAAAATMKPSQLIAHIIKETGIEKMYSGGDLSAQEGEEDSERLANIHELVTVAKRYDAFSDTDGIEQFLSDIALESDQDTMKSDHDAVRLMTVHAAKGLEFPYVFVTGMEQDLFPSRRSQDESKDLSEREEERRLFYVALTRAAKKVFLTYTSFRTIFGQRQVNVPSEFLADIDDALINFESHDGGSVQFKKKGNRVSLLGWDEDNDNVVYV